MWSSELQVTVAVHDDAGFVLNGDVGDEGNVLMFCAEVLEGIIGIDVDVMDWVNGWDVIKLNFSMCLAVLKPALVSPEVKRGVLWYSLCHCMVGLV